LKLRSVTAFFLVYVVALSFIPLIHQVFVSQSSWLGYGTGDYAYQGPSYFVLFNNPYDGSSKPNIHVNPSFAPSERISLVEFSDWTSYVDGYNMFNDFNVTIRSPSPQLLDITYTRPGLVLQKTIDTSSPNQVIVKFVANKEVIAHFELWKWLITNVNGFNITNTPKPSFIPNSTAITYTFLDQSTQATGHAQILLSRVPEQIEVWPFENGFNRVSVDFINSEMAFTVSGSVDNANQPFPLWSYDDLSYVLPIVAIVVVLIYVGFERRGEKSKTRSSRTSS
jgi:hypothetical protein